MYMFASISENLIKDCSDRQIMSGEAGSTRGSIDPGPVSAGFQDLPNWCHDIYETPFGALAEILKRWPGSTQTCEQTKKERHLRLVLTIAGYPEILVGRRPLDIPLHDRSELALELSLFLDKIKSDCTAEWHSLRTFLLHYDLLNHENIDEKEFLHELIRTIRRNSTFGNPPKKLDSQTSLHREEIDFLTILHSQDESRVSLWPLNSNNLFETKPIRLDKKEKGIKINIEEKNSYFEHEFRLDEIHKWIDDWTSLKQEGLLEPNKSQQWLIGASSILESVFAKLRSHILDEKRPGSIIIDGGGRIRYISKKTSEFETDWFKQKIYSVFLQNISHPNPFADLITSKVAHYARKDSNNIVYKTIKEQSLNEDADIYWRKDKKTDTWIVTSELYELLIGEDSTKYFLPEVVVDPSKPRQGDGGNESKNRERYLLDTKPNRSWIFEKCGYCNNHEISSEGIDDADDMLQQGTFVCPFHYFLSAWGRTVTLRQTSNSKWFSKQPFIFQKGKKSLTHIICFDGNSIGLNFTKEFTDYNPPKEPNSNKIWDDQKSSILDIEEPWKYPIDMNDDMGNDERKIHSSSKADLYNRRLQVLIRKQRRSFSFNAQWWLALRKAIDDSEDCTLIPWIMAGDDMVLVNKSTSTLESILAMLKKFHKNISGFNENITLAGGIQLRDLQGNETISDCYKEAHKLESNAKLVWKKVAADKFDHLLNDEKREELNNWTEQLDKMYQWINSTEGKNCLLGDEGKPLSLIFTSNWKDYSSS